MPNATPQFDFQKCATPWPVRLSSPDEAAIGEYAHVGGIAGLVYSTVQGQPRVGNLLLTCGYGQILSVDAASGNAITQGEKLYMENATAGAHDQSLTNTATGNTFVGYALPKDMADAPTAQLVAGGGTGEVLVWFRPE